MTATKKAPNYTNEQTAEIVEAYEQGENDEERAEILENLSAKTGRAVKSIRAKLVREGVYIAKTYKPKTGGKTETKEKIVETFAAILGVTTDQLGGLEKATKPALELIRSAFLDAAARVDKAENPDGEENA
jgi:hypothetical protein